jgi:hypothetical protein
MFGGIPGIYCVVFATMLAGRIPIIPSSLLRLPGTAVSEDIPGKLLEFPLCVRCHRLKALWNHRNIGRPTTRQRSHLHLRSLGSKLDALGSLGHDGVQIAGEPNRRLDGLHRDGEGRQASVDASYRRMSGVTEMPWTTTEVATTASIIPVSQEASGAGTPWTMANIR